MGGGGRGGASLDPAGFTRPFIYVSNVDERIFRWIMWRDPQESMRGYTSRIARLRADIKNKKAQSARTGVTAVLKGYTAATYYGEKYKNNFSRNVIAKIEGSDPSLKAEYVIAGGHLDHNGITNGVVYNGADDNASGSAVTMEVARAAGGDQGAAEAHARLLPLDRRRRGPDRVAGTTRTTRPTA